MLCRLSVENYALIDQLDIAFAPGLNIITGETGAGKSILLGALGLILGSRGDISILKQADKNCVIEGEFDLTGYGMNALFEQLDLDYEPHSTIRRVITSASKSRAYINDLPVPLATLREIGERLIDIHSQHQTRLLSDNRFQIGVVDGIASHQALLDQYKSIYEALHSAKCELLKLQSFADESNRDKEYISFQLEQLQQAGLESGEQEEQERLLNELTHASDIRGVLGYALQTFDADEEGVLTRLKSLQLSIGRLQEVYPKAEDFSSRLQSALLDLRDLNDEIASEVDRVEADPVLLERTQQRLDLIYTLQQKHRTDSVEDLLRIQQEYEQRLGAIEGYGTRIEEQINLIAGLKLKAESLAENIRKGRHKAAPRVEKHVQEMLAQLGMPAARLQVELNPTEELQSDGADRVRFLFTANRNTTLQPIEKVASGGEMSRLMLTLKALIASHTQMPSLIFDEIDSGVSGSVADSMGTIIANLAVDMQIINITHLPQIASKGNHHFLVYKEDDTRGTVTRICELSPDERVDEIARMISGSDITDAARQQARLLLAL